MELSLSKLPWYAQIGAFVVVSGLAVFGFWKFYVAEVQAEIDARQTRLTALRADVAKGVATARRLPQFQAEVARARRRVSRICARCCRRRRTSPTSCAGCRGWRRSRT